MKGEVGCEPTPTQLPVLGAPLSPGHPPSSQCPATPAPPTPLSKRTCDVLTNAKSARRATSSSPSPPVRQGWGAGTATHDAGGLPHGSSYFLGRPWLRPRGPKERQGAAQQRRWPVKYSPPPPRRPARPSVTTAGGGGGRGGGPRGAAAGGGGGPDTGGGCGVLGV
jgi:hypothetical protein